jgi:hypothetical protein
LFLEEALGGADAVSLEGVGLEGFFLYDFFFFRNLSG